MSKQPTDLSVLYAIHCIGISLRKHAYSTILKILHVHVQKENFQINFVDIFHIPAKNIDCQYPRF